MSDLKQYYASKTPLSIMLLMLPIIFLSIGLVALGVVSIVRGPIFTLPESLSQQGNFFGGYITAIVGSLTFVAVIITSFKQSQQQERYFMRQYFLQGTELISSAMRSQDDLQALRIIDYFSRLALSSEDDELFLVLNTILAGKIRKQLEQPDKNTLGNYPFAVKAVSKIGSIQKEKALNRKAISA
jgi:uncharacterized membrane protein (Fun14 family)